MLILALTALPTTKALPIIRHVPQVHLVSVLWLFLPVQFMIFRSALLLHERNSLGRYEHQHHHSHHRNHHAANRALLFESILMAHTLIFLVAHCSVPFRTRLDGILAGLKAGKGNGARRKVVVGYAAEETEAFTVQDNPAEPRSVISRALFSHVVPIVLRFYRTPLQVKDVPAIREDDTPAVSVANWRLDQQEREKSASSTTGRKAIKPTKFAFRLFWHFRQLFWLQTVSSNMCCRLTRLLKLSRVVSVLVDLGRHFRLLLAAKLATALEIRCRPQVGRPQRRWQDAYTCCSTLCRLDGYRSGETSGRGCEENLN
jgi:hypothetical protein